MKIKLFNNDKSKQNKKSKQDASNKTTSKHSSSEHDKSKQSKSGSSSMAISDKSKFAIVESYKLARTNIMFSLSAYDKKVFAVTSHSKGEGKSTVSANVAISFSKLEKRVLLVDCDLRRPNVHNIFNVDNKTGLSNIIGNMVTFEDTVHRNVLPNLDAISSGTIPPNPSELLCSPRFVNMIKRLTDEYDYIILDTAAGTGEAFNAAIAVANMAIVVATPDAISVRDARIVSDEIYYGGIKDVRLVINKYNRETFRHSGFEDGDSIIDACCAQLLGVVPADEQLHLSAMTGKALTPGSTSQKVFSSMVERLNGNHTQIIVK